MTTTPTTDQLTEGLGLANHAKVYLDWNDTDRRWEVAPVTMDSYPLDGNDEVEGDLDRSQWTKADRAAAARAQNVWLPTGEELIPLLAAQSEQLPELLRLMQEADRAAQGDSNDDEIAALNEVISQALSMLGIDPDVNSN